MVIRKYADFLATGLGAWVGGRGGRRWAGGGGGGGGVVVVGGGLAYGTMERRATDGSASSAECGERCFSRTPEFRDAREGVMAIRRIYASVPDSISYASP